MEPRLVPDAEIEGMLSGGHPNSLGRTVEVVDLVLADEDRLAGLYSCYGSTDPVVRLRVSSALKRVCKERPELLVPYVDGLQTDVAELDQASAQWTLATLFDLLRSRMDAKQLDRAVAIMRRNLDTSDDWIVQNTTMQVLHEWSEGDPDAARWLRPRLERLAESPRRSVSGRARKLLGEADVEGRAQVPGS